MHLLIVVATQREADAIARWPVASSIVVSGVGRVNAACATTQALAGDPTLQGVVSAGIAGSLPGSGLELGAMVVADTCVYMEEGLMTPEGFRDLASMGFPLGDFDGNAVPADAGLLRRFRTGCTVAPIATVATCSGTDAAAEAVRSRTGAVAEAMEGAAIVHAARRLRLPGIEIRAISNSTGHRDDQIWNLDLALETLRAFAAG